jgi:hypothetical protein
MYVHLYFAATASSSDRDRNPGSLSDHTAEPSLIGRENRGRELQASDATERHGRALGVARCRCDAAQLDQA